MRGEDLGRKVAVILSGGMDSTTLAYAEKASGNELFLISFDYGQRHSKELEFAALTASRLDAAHVIVPMNWFASHVRKSALTNDNIAVPYGHYGAETMKATVVPNRNMVMLAIAVSMAISEGCDEVLYGAHPGDHAVYADCREDFVNAMKSAIELCDFGPVKLRAPFVESGLNKSGIAALGKVVGVPWVQTWSCYEGGKHHCGNCGTCVERREALANVDDTTVYASTAKPLDELLSMR